eukprot:CAMPEP_0115482224 /NCGR_PEP_ID=MMETSP0271-20121206/58216_1 /TAXON_ID=71861 /ORGANISM="Scrippsiella trochoidea, Strain CCMP3099" /LENGTH=273 /DNA_ID=CAMNT_0002910009 /DNA_START=58 /DNA_END=879 /DNA_ORIENTATION=+
MAESSQFSFTVPACEPGSTLQVKATDGVTLKIPLPENVLPGDELYMAKGAEGKWGILKAIRGTPTPATAAAPASAPAWRSAEAMAAECASPEAVTVRLDTTKGPILIKVVPSWSPIGAERFLKLVDDGYFQDISIYRAINSGLLQFGVVKDTDERSKRYDPLPDDVLAGIPYAEGVVGFAAAGPGTRKSTICIMKADFRTQLGKGALGTKSTETPFGMVCPESMATMHSIHCYGDIPQCGGKGPCPGKLAALGNDYIRSEFPLCDFVTGACRA